MDDQLFIEEMLADNRELFQYIRKGQVFKYNKILKRNLLVDRGFPIGIMISFPIRNTNTIGIAFTRFHIKKEPYWNNELAMNIVIDRALQYYDSIYIPKFAQKIPKYVKRQFKKFIDRSRRYYKGYELPKWTERFENDIKNPIFQAARVKKECEYDNQ